MKRHPVNIFILLLFCVFYSKTTLAIPDVGNPAVTEERSDSNPNYLVGVGDLLSIKVWSGDLVEKDLLGNYSVYDGGVLRLPLVGEFETEGLSASEVSNGLTAALSNYIINPIVQVQVIEYASQSVSVLGAVSHPGVVYLQGPKTVLQALAERGLTRAKKSFGAYAQQKVHLQRLDGSLIVLDLERLLTQGEGNEVLRSGDMVFVTDGAYIYVSGKVNRQGAVPFRTGMTITDAIAESAGIAKQANTRAVFILRDGERIRVNVKRIFQGGAPDVLLKEGDRLFIETSKW